MLCCAGEVHAALHDNLELPSSYISGVCLFPSKAPRTDSRSHSASWLMRSLPSAKISIYTCLRYRSSRSIYSLLFTTRWKTYFTLVTLYMKAHWTPRPGSLLLTDSGERIRFSTSNSLSSSSSSSDTSTKRNRKCFSRQNFPSLHAALHIYTSLSSPFSLSSPPSPALLKYEMTDSALQTIVKSVEAAAPIVHASQWVRFIPSHRVISNLNTRYLTLSGCSFLLYDYLLTVCTIICYCKYIHILIYVSVHF